MNDRDFTLNFSDGAQLEYHSNHYDSVRTTHDNKSTALDVIDELSKFLIANFDPHINPVEVEKARRMNISPINSSDCCQAIEFIKMFNGKEITVVKDEFNYHPESGLYINCWKRELRSSDFNMIPWLDAINRARLKPNTATITHIITISSRAFQSLWDYTIELNDAELAKEAKHKAEEAKKKAKEAEYLIHGQDLQYCQDIHKRRMKVFVENLNSIAPLIAEIPDNEATKSIIRNKRRLERTERIKKRQLKHERQHPRILEEQRHTGNEITIDQLKDIQMGLMKKMEGHSRIDVSEKIAYVNWFRSPEKYHSFKEYKEEAGSVICFFICIEPDKMSATEYQNLWMYRSEYVDQMASSSYKKAIKEHIREMEKIDSRRIRSFADCSIQ